MTSSSGDDRREDRDPREEATLDLFRRWGYLQADLDDLGRLLPEPHPELDAAEGGTAEAARAFYCGPLAAQFMHIPDPERRRWVAERMEKDDPDEVDGERVLDLLLTAETFEQVLQRKYLGNKRFSIEGIAALIPLLATIVERAADDDARQVVIAMSHRGRLNVMLQLVGRSAVDLFAGFEDVDPRSILGAGDVKYHLGATGTWTSASGQEVSIHLVSNPSHLEAVDPVALGRVRAKQVRIGDERGSRVIPILLHGDAAFAGQGIAAECLNMPSIHGFSVGGAIHVVVNNLIGFTTEPPALHSSRFASDMALRVPIPIFHVNGERPEAVVRAARLAAAYRARFGDDVVVDLIGFRRHGHSEVDDPTITQPGLYAKIEERPPLWESWAGELGIGEEERKQREKEVRDALDEAKEEAEELDELPRLATHPEYWSQYVGGVWRPELEVDTGVERGRLEALAGRIASAPGDFAVHPKVEKLLEQRREMGRGERPLDYGMAEALAFASLLAEGVPIRMSGQDSRRGTFSHRHSVWIDTENGDGYCPFLHVADDQGRFEIYDSMLSEAAIVGYEYGYSRDSPETLTLWEAQFGDFANGAQVILDQFVAAGEDKWGLLSGLVLLLPHGYEGQGPEHSSARMERYLQLAAEDAIQVCQPSTAGQYFHLLRRQALRKWRKPLVVFTPKSMLRSPKSASELDALSRDRFLPVLPDESVEEADRVLVASGKIVHELREERKERGAERTAIIAVEQLYPFPDRELGEALDRHRSARELLWVQEEPANMGALSFVAARIERHARGRHLRSVKRSASASPATGSAKAHQLEQKTLLALAFGGRSGS